MMFKNDDNGENGSKMEATNIPDVQQDKKLTRSLCFSPRLTSRIHIAEEQPSPKLSGLKIPPISSNEKMINPSKQSVESRKSFFLQTCVPFVLAGFGMVAAGVLLDRASSCLFFTKVPEALILVPALLGLKGNLEMTLASRLSTMANLGQLDQKHQQITALYSNIALVQAQAIVVALFASILAMLAVHLFGRGQQQQQQQYEFSRAFCLVFSAIVTASLASFILSSLMVLIAISSHKCGLNPDNIVTPLAAALGDFISLAILILIGTWSYRIRNDHLHILLTVSFLLIISALFWARIAASVPSTLMVLKYGWFAVIAAMGISSTSGFIFENALQHFPAIALFQPLINGVGGNLVAVQSSKISTYLHQHAKSGVLPAGSSLITYLNPLRAFSGHERESHNATILLALSVPGHLLFLGLLLLISKVDSQSLHLSFLAVYLLATFLQVAFLLYCCQFLCRALWRLHWNPDNNAIPLLTGLGDLLGTSFLVLAFVIHQLMFPPAECHNFPDGKTASNIKFDALNGIF